MIFDKDLLALKRMQSTKEPKTSSKDHLIHWVLMILVLSAFSVFGAKVL